MQELRAVVAQLTADNVRLLEEQAAAPPVVNDDGASTSSAPPPNVSARNDLSVAAPMVTERLLYVPCDCRCPMFSGKSGIRKKPFFLFDHLEGEARDEIKYRSRAERGDPGTVISILKDLYECSESYVALQEAFFSHRQQEGETLQEFSLVLMSLMDKVKLKAPASFSNADVLLCDQFVEQVSDPALRQKLKQLVRQEPDVTVLDVRADAIQWEREGRSGGTRGLSHSVPSAYGIQYGVQGSGPVTHTGGQTSDLSELKDILK